LASRSEPLLPAEATRGVLQRPPVLSRRAGCCDTLPVVGYLDPLGYRRAPLYIRCAAAVRAQNFERHDLGLPVDPGHTDAVVPFGGYRASDMRAVLVPVARIIDRGVIVVEVPAVHVYVAVLIIVNLVARYFTHPDVVLEVRVVSVYSGVDNGDDGARASGGDAPSLRRVNVGVGCTR